MSIAKTAPVVQQNGTIGSQVADQTAHPAAELAPPDADVADAKDGK